MPERTEFLLTPREVARVVGVTTELLRKWRERGKGPAWAELEGLVRYREADVQTWVVENRHQPEPDSDVSDA